MTTPQHAELRRLFELAIAVRGDDRSALLERECRGDAALKQRIEAMIAAAEDKVFLSEATAGVLPSGAIPTVSSRGQGAAALLEGPGTRIGPYKLLQQIGEGGFGSVFMAEQEKPVARKVALKIIKLGMDTRQVVARFEQERQALAMMDHPNIARVLDAGATETGRPFFVMELVKGDPIVEYCDKNNLNIHDRLELFAQVCLAVQHAHTKGIIHRDIKPSNVLVSTQDGKSAAKVIDFGIAKATAAKLTEKTLFTEHKQLIGTPEYMSPEQAEGSMDIDTRTDVYSLGVLLYELLTGSTPFSGKDLRSAAFGEIQRIIREVEPPKPSTRLSENSDTIASIAAHRCTEPRRLGAIVRGELDWIVMKALEKDRARRYETANGLAMDIRRYLAGEALVAAPPGAAYRFRKFVRRHKVAVTAGTLVAATLLAGGFGTTWGMIWALDEKARANNAAAAERKAQEQSQARADALQKVVAFQSAQLAGVDVMQMGIRLRRDLLDRVRQAGTQTPESETQARIAAVDSALASVDLTGLARSALESSIFTPTIDAIHEQFADQPEVRADLLLTVSDSARRLGALDLAERPGSDSLEIRSSVLGPDNEKTLEARKVHALLRKDKGKLDEAEREMKESLAVAVRAHGADSKIAMDLLANLATIRSARADFQGAADLYAQALPWFRQHSGPLDKETLACMASLASALSNLGRHDEAEPLFKEAVGGFRTVHGRNNQRTIQAMNNLAGFYRSKKDYAKATEVYEEALQASRGALGEDHGITLMIIDNIGGVRFAQGDLKEAAEFARAALDGRRRALGENHPATLRSCFNLAKVLESRDEAEEAVALYRRAVDGFRGAYGEFHSYTSSARSSLAGLLMKKARFQECADVLLAEQALFNHAPAPPKERERAVIRALGILYEKWDAAEPNRGHAAEAARWKNALDALDAAGK